MLQLAESANTDDVPQWDIEHYDQLKKRLIGELSRGMSMLQIANQTQPPRSEFNQNYSDVGTWEVSLKEWLKDGSKFRQQGRYFEQLPLATVIENALSKWFCELDEERSTQTLTPCFIPTSVALSVMKSLGKTRTLQELVEVPVPAGHGKTSGVNQYINDCRLKEGIDCPVWLVTLSETNVTLKNILYEIAIVMHDSMPSRHTFSPNENMKDFELERLIRSMASFKQKGLIILDEAQSISYFNGNVPRPNGLEIIQKLRNFTDSNLFGIALMSNGETLKRASSKTGSPQLASRIISERVVFITENDIDLMMQAYGISGKRERAWCVYHGMGAGGLRNLYKAFISVSHDFNEINFAALQAYKPMVTKAV